MRRSWYRLRDALVIVVAIMLFVGFGATATGARVAPGSGDALEGITVTSVRPGTRVLLANARPFLVKGYNHWPNALGEGTAIADPYFDPSQCARDGRLLRGAGATAVRIWLNFGRAMGEVPTIRACADEFASEGIGVAWTIGQPGGIPTDPGFKEQFELYIDRAVQALATSPGTLIWLIGNEIELLSGCDSLCTAAWFGTPGGPPGMLDALSARVKAQDRHHLVGTSTSARACFAHLSEVNVPSLDVWGLNVYPARPDLTNHCGREFFEHLNDLDPRPKFLTEFGTDRFRCVPAIETNDPENNYIESCEAATSGEDQAAQAHWLSGIWDSMSGHLATDTNPTGALSGGQVFLFADIWEHCLFFCVGTPMTHEVAAYEFGVARNAPDGNISLEWWGVVHAQLRGATTPRVTTLGFDALARRWSNPPPPTMTQPPVIEAADGACATPTVAWRTNQPGTSEVQLAVDGRTLDADGFLASDNTIYQQVAHDLTERRVHQVEMPSLQPGVQYRIVPRTFTSDGRSVTALPLEYRYTEGCP